MPKASKELSEQGKRNLMWMIIGAYKREGIVLEKFVFVGMEGNGETAFYHNVYAEIDRGKNVEDESYTTR